jgi:hypothetical protein
MLAGCRVLVVENEALVAEAISEVLIEAEGAPVGLRLVGIHRELMTAAAR